MLGMEVSFMVSKMINIDPNRASFVICNAPSIRDSRSSGKQEKNLS